MVMSMMGEVHMCLADHVMTISARFLHWVKEENDWARPNKEAERENYHKDGSRRLDRSIKNPGRDS